MCLLNSENILTFLSLGAFPERKFSQIISLGVCNRSVLYDVLVFTFLGTILEHALHSAMHTNAQTLHSSPVQKGAYFKLEILSSCWKKELGFGLVKFFWLYP